MSPLQLTLPRIVYRIGSDEEHTGELAIGVERCRYFPHR